MVRTLQLAQDLAVPIDFDHRAAHVRLLAEIRVVRHLTVVEQRPAISEISVITLPIRHRPRVHDGAVQIDEMHLIQKRRREQGQPRTCADAIDSMQADAATPNRILIDRRRGGRRRRRLRVGATGRSLPPGVREHRGKLEESAP